MFFDNFYIKNGDKTKVTPELLLRKMLPLIAFVVVFLLSLDFLFINYVVVGNDWSNEGKVRRIVEQTHMDEIPVFGASVARSSFIPDSISVNCYNYGMGKALYDVTRFFLKEECAKNKNTPIIFEINPRTFIKNPKSTINTSAFIPSLDFPEVEEFMKESGVYDWHYEVPGMRFYGNYFQYAITPLKRAIGRKMDINGAFLETEEQTAEDFDLFLKRLNNVNRLRQELMERRENPNKAFTQTDYLALDALNTLVYFSVDEQYLEEFTGLIESNPQRDFILVSVPIHKLMRKELPNFDEFISFTEDLAERYENVHYFNYTDLPTEFHYFKDPSHFNEAGAQYFSGIFAKDFRRITGIMPNGDKRI